MKYKRDANKLLEAYYALLALPLTEDLLDRISALITTFSNLKNGTKHQELWTYIADKAAVATDAWMTKNDLHNYNDAMEMQAAACDWSDKPAGMFADGEPYDEGFLEEDFH